MELKLDAFGRDPHIDQVLPICFCIAPLLFTAIGDALEWVRWRGLGLLKTFE